MSWITLHQELTKIVKPQWISSNHRHNNINQVSIYKIKHNYTITLLRCATNNYHWQSFIILYNFSFLDLQGQIRSKLQYEWKNVYRYLNNADTSQTGTVTRKQFEGALSKTGVFLSNEDVKYLQDNYGDESNHKNIKYDVMSQSLGLHSNSFNIMRETHSKINRLKTAS